MTNGCGDSGAHLMGARWPSPKGSEAFVGHHPASDQTYNDVKHTIRNPLIKSATLKGHPLDSSLPV